jgi:glutamate dehydrogenase
MGDSKTMKSAPKPINKKDEIDNQVFEDSDDLNGGDDQPLSYEVIKTGDDLESYIDDIADTVRIGLDQSIAILTPWFFNNMPRIYYQTTPRQEKVRHLSAIITGHVFETKQTVELWDRDHSKVTYIGPGGDRKILVDMAHKLTTIENLKMGALYFSRDKLLFLSTFFCNSHRPLDLSNTRIVEKVSAARKLMERDFPDRGATIQKYVDNLDNDFVVYATAARLQITFRMVNYMETHEGALTFVEPIANSSSARLTLGIKNVRPGQVMESIIHLIHRYGYNVIRSFVVNFEEGYDEPITVMHFIIETTDKKAIDPDSISMRKLNKALRTLGLVDVDGFSRFTLAPYDLSINAANLVRAMANWTHVHLGKYNPHIFSIDRIEKVVFNYSDITKEMVELFRMKFDLMKAGERNADGYKKIKEGLIRTIDETVIEEVDRQIFREFISFIDATLRTNYFISSKTGLAFRLSPDILNSEFYPNKPFGIFYIIGRGFRTFQVRWKDIARGGLRVVMPRNQGDYNYALLGMFDEVYGLSYAQQLKNKDIPEGGSKAVLLLSLGGHRDQAVRAAVNALLDLLVTEDESHEGTTKEQVTYYDKEEIIYLGPDENVTNELIVWITEHAARRGYPYARAFMSSKPGDGINHKEFGVTSEGLNVFVDNILRFVGINPNKNRFTVKITGGPDGDVAGNELKILHREYGENCRVVSIADGFGAAYDPEGLDWNELLRLVLGGFSIAHFDKSKLTKSPDAFVIKADTNQNIRIRDELTARIHTDIFIPAGGRPYTVNGKNWNAYVDKNGKASMRVVVEGANIFFTAGARDNLQKAGVLMIKDSSANKTGVICSSFEIIACLTISSEEFKEIKPTYVKQVIDILRQKADAEAKLLMRYFQQYRGEKTLVDLSMDISKEINEVTDCLLDELGKRKAEVLAEPMFQNLIYRHCPPILVEKFKDRILKRLPEAHQIAILSAYIASFIVYREGLGWLHSIPEDMRYKMARSYMEKDVMATEMIDSVRKSSLKNRSEIAEILSRSGARHLAMFEFESEGMVSTEKKS